MAAEDGRYLGTVMVIRDIAERRTLERRLLDAERLSGLGQMSAQIAHELRNPLNAIDGAAQYLRRRLAGDPEVAEYAGLIGEEVQRVNLFVSELLGVARPAEPSFAPTSVNRLLRDAAQKAALARGLAADAVRLDLAADLPVVDVDAPMMTDALVNLLGNAFDAGGTEPPEVASRYEAAGGEGTIVVEVRDRGCGIPADQLDEVLRPFVTTKAHGTGLGLVVVQRAVEQHRARFALGPREGGGTVAAIRFPVRRIVSAIEAEPAAEGAVHVERRGAGAGGGRRPRHPQGGAGQPRPGGLRGAGGLVAAPRRWRASPSPTRSPWCPTSRCRTWTASR